MKNTLFVLILLVFTNTVVADIFGKQDKKAAQIDKYCLGGAGWVRKEMVTDRNKNTGKIISEQIATVVYCNDGSRHIVGKENNQNKLVKDLVDGLNQKRPGKKYKCDFPGSLLMGTCNGNQYYYIERFSSVKRKDLSKFYRFVQKTGSTAVSEICVDVKTQVKNTIKCHDLGIVLELE